MTSKGRDEMETDDPIAPPRDTSTIVSASDYPSMQKAEERSLGIPAEVQVLRAYRAHEMTVRGSLSWND